MNECAKARSNKNTELNSKALFIIRHLIFERNTKKMKKKKKEQKEKNDAKTIVNIKTNKLRLYIIYTIHIFFFFFYLKIQLILFSPYFLQIITFKHCMRRVPIYNRNERARTSSNNARVSEKV